LAFPLGLLQLLVNCNTRPVRLCQKIIFNKINKKMIIITKVKGRLFGAVYVERE